MRKVNQVRALGGVGEAGGARVCGTWLRPDQTPWAPARPHQVPKGREKRPWVAALAWPRRPRWAPQQPWPGASREPSTGGAHGQRVLGPLALRSPWGNPLQESQVKGLVGYLGFPF